MYGVDTSSLSQANEGTFFNGWTKMCLPVTNFQVTKVTKPNVGENHPALVTAELSWCLKDLRHDLTFEWDTLRKHDVLYLLTIRSPIVEGEKFKYDKDKDFCEQFGVVYARGCEIDEKFDEDGKIIPEWEDRPIKGSVGAPNRARSLQYSYVHGARLLARLATQAGTTRSERN